MKKTRSQLSKRPILLVVALLTAPAAGLLAGTETAVCTAAAGQGYPAISGDRIVWTDDRNGNDDIYMFEIDQSPGPNNVPEFPSVFISPIALIGLLLVVLVVQNRRK